MQSITLLIKPASYHCNMSCGYCFYKRVRSVYPEKSCFMTLDTARELVRRTLALGCRESQFCWQGGEPSLLGLDFFREIVKFQAELAAPGQIVINTFQTNGTLIDEAWAGFFARYRFLVGLSLDGPRHIHDRYRRFGSGKGTFDLVMKTANLLKESGVRFNILSLLTEAGVAEPVELYRFFREKGFSHLQFIPCVEWDPLTKESLPFSISGHALGKFYCNLFDTWLRDGFWNVSIRAFEDILLYYIDHAHVSCTHSERCDSYLLVEHNGDVYPCDFFVYPEWKLGNIIADGYEKVLANRVRRGFALLKADLPEECKDCKWLDFCHGDCLKFRGNDLGRSGGSSVICEAHRMLLEHMSPHLESIRQTALRFRRDGAGRKSPAGVGRNSPCPCGSGLKHKKCCGR